LSSLPLHEVVAHILDFSWHLRPAVHHQASFMTFDPILSARIDVLEQNAQYGTAATRDHLRPARDHCSRRGYRPHGIGSADSSLNHRLGLSIAIQHEILGDGGDHIRYPAYCFNQRSDPTRSAPTAWISSASRHIGC